MFQAGEVCADTRAIYPWRAGFSNLETLNRCAQSERWGSTENLRGAIVTSLPNWLENSNNSCLFDFAHLRFLIPRLTPIRAFQNGRGFLALLKHRLYTPNTTVWKGKPHTLEFEPRDQFEQRLKKLEQIQALGHEAFPREFRWTESPADLVKDYAAVQGPELEANRKDVRVAGRIVSYRLMGKAGFAHLQGAGKRIQIYVRKDVVGDQGFQLFHLLDLGDHIGVRGHLFRTKTGELSILGGRTVLSLEGSSAITGKMAWAFGHRTCGIASVIWTSS